MVRQQIRIVTFINDREGREMAEDELTLLVNEGYDIKVGGGGQGASMMWGFVILQRAVPEGIPNILSDPIAKHSTAEVPKADAEG